MDLERNTFISSLEKFTSLNSLREIKQKNVGAIRTMITIAQEDGNFLQDSWVHVLKLCILYLSAQVLRCFSLLERLHLIGSGVKEEALTLPETPADTAKTLTFLLIVLTAAVEHPGKEIRSL